MAIPPANPLPTMGLPGDLLGQSFARTWGVVVLRGVCGIVFGLIALFMPGITLWTLTITFAAYMLVDGVFTIAAGIRSATHHGRWGLLILEGVIDLIAGVVALTMPGLTVLVFVTVMGVWAIISGVLEIVAAFRLAGSHGRWWLGLAGVVSVVWGVLLLLAPMTGAIVLAWWLGIYALLFGIALVVLGFQLRSRNAAGPGGAVMA